MRRLFNRFYVAVFLLWAGTAIAGAQQAKEQKFDEDKSGTQAKSSPKDTKKKNSKKKGGRERTFPEDNSKSSQDSKKPSPNSDKDNKK